MNCMPGRHHGNLLICMRWHGDCLAYAWCTIVYSNSALLVLIGTSLNSINALLALNWRYVLWPPLKIYPFPLFFTQMWYSLQWKWPTSTPSPAVSHKVGWLKVLNHYDIIVSRFFYMIPPFKPTPLLNNIFAISTSFSRSQTILVTDSLSFSPLIYPHSTSVIHPPSILKGHRWEW